MATQAISLARTCGTHLVTAAITIKNVIVSVALQSLQFLHACYVKCYLRWACRPASNPYVFRHLHKLPEPAELIRSPDGQIRVAFLCHNSFTVYNHYLPLSAAMTQKYGTCIYRAFIDPTDGITPEDEKAFLANTPNVFILSEGPNAIVQDNDGQYSTSGFFNYWKTQYHTEDRKQARVFIVDPLRNLNIPSLPLNSYDALSNNNDRVYRARGDIVVRRIAYYRGVTT